MQALKRHEHTLVIGLKCHRRFGTFYGLKFESIEWKVRTLCFFHFTYNSITPSTIISSFIRKRGRLNKKNKLTVKFIHTTCFLRLSYAYENIW